MNWPDYFSKMFPPPAVETRDEHDVSAAAQSDATPAAGTETLQERVRRIVERYES